MILSYRDKRTENFSHGEREKAFESISKAGRMKLNQLRAADTLASVAALPGNRFEYLRGDREGQCSIRINEQWRVCFTWDDETKGFANVEIVDYH